MRDETPCAVLQDIRCFRYELFGDRTATHIFGRVYATLCEGSSCFVDKAGVKKSSFLNSDAERRTLSRTCLSQRNNT